jgi:hypothetical protein
MCRYLQYWTPIKDEGVEDLKNLADIQEFFLAEVLSSFTGFTILHIHTGVKKIHISVRIALAAINRLLKALPLSFPL